MDILIAEDEKDIAFMYLKIFEDRGDNVIVTNNGQECLDIYHDRVSRNRFSNSNPFDVAILDHKMPNMDGFQVAREIISINPDQRIIIASGYNKDIFEEARNSFQIPIEVIQKPFSRLALIDLIERKDHNK